MSFSSVKWLFCWGKGPPNSSHHRYRNPNSDSDFKITLFPAVWVLHLSIPWVVDHGGWSLSPASTTREKMGPKQEQSSNGRTRSPLPSQRQLLKTQTPPIAQIFRSLFIFPGSRLHRTWFLVILGLWRTCWSCSFIPLVCSSNSITPTATMALTVSAIHPRFPFPWCDGFVLCVSFSGLAFPTQHHVTMCRRYSTCPWL